MIRPRRIRGKSPGGRIDLSTALLLFWAMFIIYGTMLPFDFTIDLTEAARRVHALALGAVSWTDVVSNVLLFVPWGVLLASRLARRGAGQGMTLIGATLSGLALSGLVECGQLFLPSRTTSLVDLITNTAGAALGASVGWPLIRRVGPVWLPPLRRLVVERPLAGCALAAAVVLVLAGLSPFDVSLNLDDLKGAIKAARPIPFGPPLRGPAPLAEPWSWAQEELTWALAGGLVALALGEAGWSGSRAFAAVAALCGGLALMIEALQVVIPSRTTDMTSVVFALTGSVAGAAAVSLSPRQDPRRWIGPALAVWAIAVILAAWSPPHLASSEQWSLRWSQLVPFWAYYQRTDVYAISDLLNQVFRFVPLGALLAARDARGSARRALVLGLGCGLVLEAGQLVLADRTAEITDALLAGVGAVLGARSWGWGTSIRAQASGHMRYRVR